MNKTIFRPVMLLLIALAIIVGAWLIAADNVSAESGDRTTAGAIAMPAGRVITAPEKTWTKINFGTKSDYESFHYIKIKPKKTGIITFKNDYANSYIALCNEKKKVISADNSYTNGDFYSWNSNYKYQTFVQYGVKKGKTYLIRIKGNSMEHTTYDAPYIGSVYWTSKSIKQAKSGKNKKKAAKLKRKKVVKGLFPAGSNKSKWYKINTNKKTTKVTLKSLGSNGYINAKVYYKSFGRWYSSNLSVTRSTDFLTDTRKVYSSGKKNTYYVQVYPKKGISGAYSVKWK